MNQKLAADNLALLSMPSYPALGDGKYFDSSTKEIRDIDIDVNPSENNVVSRSAYTHDELTNSHNRFSALIKNIRDRRGKKVEIKVPIFVDENTLPENTHIHMDSMHFGMGMCSFQLTYES